MSKPKGQRTRTRSKPQARHIVAATLDHLSRNGPPRPSYTQIEEGAGLSRQLIRYYFADPDDLMCEVCDLLTEAYRTALVNGLNNLTGPSRLEFVFDFYFDLVDDLRKPRDDQAYDAVMAFAAGSPRVKSNLRGQYTLLGQVLQLELKSVHRELELEDCAEISYLFVCLMYGHWKMVASLGIAEDHRLVARRAVDRIIASYLRKDLPKQAAGWIWTAGK